MKPAAILGLLALITGAITLAAAVRLSFSTIPGAIAIEQIDWPNVLVGAILSLSGSALINLATAKSTRTTKRRQK